MWLMLQQSEPDDYVLATGENRSVREFAEHAFREIGRTLRWQGSDVAEEGFDAETGERLVAIDPRFFRRTEINGTLGDSSKARRVLGWSANISFTQLVREMVEADVARAELLLTQRSGGRDASR
jgi:GDPmannose 4,6-dehydratase